MMPTRFWDGLAHVPIAAWQSSGLPEEVVRDVRFRDALLNQDDTSLAANPASAEEYLRWRRALVQAVVYASPGMSMPGIGATPSLVAITKLLHRGQSPPLYPSVSKALDHAFGEDVAAYFSAYPAAAGVDPLLDLLRAWGAGRIPPAIDSPIRVFDDDQPKGKGEERRFWARMQRNQAGAMRRWVHPQVLFSTMRFPDKAGVPDSRRVDYLLGWPMSAPRVWEIHGHLSKIDINKSEDMRLSGWQVEDDVLDPPDKRKEITVSRVGWQAPTVPEQANNQRLFDWLDAAWCAAQVERTLALLLTKGVWSARQSRIAIVVPSFALDTARAAVEGFLETLRAVEAVWQPDDDKRLLSEQMTVTCSADHEGANSDIVVRVDPLQASYLAAAECMPPNEIWVRRLTIPSDLAMTELPDAKHLLRHAPPDEAPELALVSVLRRAFGFETFNAGQVESIRQGLAGRNVLLLLPTGGGKSLVFQLLSLLLPGAVMVIEGWKALMDDQWRNLRARGWDCGMAIHGDRPMPRREEALLEAGIIYVSPERFYVEDFEAPFKRLLETRGVSLFVIDEAHAVSECGHSYRPSYIDLVNRMEWFARGAGVSMPVVFAMTATAPDIVLRDIANTLRIKAEPVTAMNDDGSARLVRTNITDEIVRLAPGQGANEMEKALSAVMHQAQPNNSNGIIFCASKKKWTTNKRGARWYGVAGTVDVLMKILGSNGKDRVATYTGGSLSKLALAQQVADKNAFLDGRKRVMVATNAFGTGIDMPHVDWVVHIGMPSGLEAYYQEIGRAGRSGQPARAWLLLDEDSGQLGDALVAARQDARNVSALRDSLNGATSGLGSIARQLNLLVGSDDFTPSPLMNIQANLPPGKRLPSFPGIECEHQVVDHQIISLLEPLATASEFEFVFAPDWDSLVWKAVIRFKALGLIEPFYRRSFKMTGANAFVVTKTDWAARLSEDVLIPAFERAVRLMRSEGEAESAAKELRGAIAGMPAKDVAMAALRRLLDHSYALMREARMGSLMELRSYALEPSPVTRRQMIEDYFAKGSYFQKIADLSEKSPPRLVDWQEALQEARGQGVKRRGVYLRVLSGQPDAPLPAFLLIDELLRYSEDEQAIQFYLTQVLFTASLGADLHRWVWSAFREAAGIALPDFEHMVAAAIKNLSDDRRAAVVELMMGSMEQAEGGGAVADVVVSEFGRIALRGRA